MTVALSEEVLTAAELVIALQEAEHRRMLNRQFPDWPDRVRYWHVHDLDLATGEQATAEIEGLVVELIEALRPESPERSAKAFPISDPARGAPSS